MSPFFKDLTERIVRTFLAVLFSALTTVATTSASDPAAVKVAITTAVGTAVTAAFGVASRYIGNPDTASAIDLDASKDGEGYPADL